MDEAIDSFGKNICFLFVELCIIAIVAIAGGYALGLIKFEEILDSAQIREEQLIWEIVHIEK